MGHLHTKSTGSLVDATGTLKLEVVGSNPMSGVFFAPPEPEIFESLIVKR